MVALRLIRVVFNSWHTVKCDTLAVNLFQWKSRKQVSRLTIHQHVVIWVPSKLQLKNSCQLTASLAWMLRLLCSTVSGVPWWSLATAFCWSHRRVRHALSPGCTARTSLILISPWWEDGWLACLQKHISLINCWAPCVWNSSLLRFMLWSRQFGSTIQLFARRRCKKFIASWLIFRLKKLIWKVSKNAFKCNEETNCW